MSSSVLGSWEWGMPIGEEDKNGMQKILITGGCGFIGLSLIDFLHRSQSGHQVIVLDNLSLGKREHLSGYDVEFIEGDIRDKEVVAGIMKKVSAVIHLAADTRVMDSIANPDFNFDVNVGGTYNLLRAARAAGVERFVFASTGGAIIGEATPPVHEGMVPKPLSPYGASKLAAEGYLSAFAASYGMKTVALRFSNVYGPRSYHKGSVVAAFFKKILKGEPLTVYGDGSQTRDYVFSDDLCSAIVKALNVNAGREAYQLGSGVGTSLNELIHKIRQVVGNDHPFEVRYEPFRPGEIKHNYADISKARKSLGYAPQVGLTEGLEKTWQWFRSAALKNH